MDMDDGYGWMDIDGWIWIDAYGWMDMDGWIWIDGVRGLVWGLDRPPLGWLVGGAWDPGGWLLGGLLGITFGRGGSSILNWYYTVTIALDRPPLGWLVGGVWWSWMWLSEEARRRRRRRRSVHLI